MIPSLERWSTKAKDTSSFHEVRLTPLVQHVDLAPLGEGDHSVCHGSGVNNICLKPHQLIFEKNTPMVGLGSLCAQLWQNGG